MKTNIRCCKKQIKLPALLNTAAQSYDALDIKPSAIQPRPYKDNGAALGKLAINPNTTFTDHVEQCTVLGTEKQLALLFLDIRNFTSFMEQRSPYDVIYVIRKMFALFNESITELGGKIVETMGDSIYAVFGLQTNIKDAVKSALNASLAIFHDLEIFNTTHAQPFLNLNFEIGIGLHQGNVLVGQYDMDYHDHMTVMGLPVNIAARLQAETREVNNDLLVSEDVYRLLDLPQNAIESRHVKLKGISQPVEVRLMGHAYQAKAGTDDMLDYYISMAG